jgi:drug/metabolite transporter (DMT)-like permease
VLRVRLLALDSAMCFAALGVFSKKAYQHGAGSLEVLTTRIVISAIVLGAIGLAVRAAWPHGRALGVALGMGVFQLASSAGLLFGFDHAPAALIVLIFYAYPILVSVGAALLFGEPFGRRQVSVLGLSLVGLALTAGRPGSTPSVGVALGLLAAIGMTGYFLAGRYVLSEGVDPLVLTSVNFILPSVVLLAVVAAHGARVPNATASGYALGVAVLCTIVPVVMLVSAIRIIGAGTSALLSTVEPLIAVLLAYLLLGERLSPTQLVGGCFIAAGVCLSALPAWLRPSPSAA